MTKAINAETTFGYIAETTPGTTPANPAYIVANATAENLQMDRTFRTSKGLVGLRSAADAYTLASERFGGNVTFDLVDTVYEDFFAAALRGAWAADTVANGNATISFSLATRYKTGAATNVWKLMQGAEVNTLQLNVTASGDANMTVGFVARNGAFSDTTPTGATFGAIPSGRQLMNGASVPSVLMSGLTPGCVSSLSLSLDNRLNPTACLGKTRPDDFAAGDLEATAELTVYLDHPQYSILQGYVGGTETTLSFNVTGATKTYNFLFPRVFIETASVAAENSETGEVMVSVSVRALRDATGRVLRIVRANI